MGFYKEIAIKELNKEQIVKCDCCNEDADFSDYGINLCHDCKRDNCEGLGHLYDAFVRLDMMDKEDF